MFLTRIRPSYIWPLAAGIFTTFPAHADAPLRGNPVDSLPRLERSLPAPTVPPTSPTAPTPEQRAVAARLAQRIVPRHFDVAGARAMPFDEVAAVLKPLAGKEITIADLVQEVDKITAMYRERGYPLSFAVLQNQDFKDGKVMVTVVEGYVANVRIEGDIGNARARLEALAGPLLKEKPLTQATLERVLNLMRTVPGVRITPKLDLPRRADGATDLQIAATRQAYQGGLGMSDLGTGMQPLANIGFNSLTPLGEQVRLTAGLPVGSNAVTYYAGEARVPIGNDGLSLKLDGYRYKARPRSDSLDLLGYRRKVFNDHLGLGLSYPLLLNNRRSLTGTLGMYMADGQDRYELDGTSRWLQQNTRVRAASAELRYIDLLPQRTTEITASVSHGLNGLGARKNIVSNYGYSADPDLRLDFTRFNLQARQSFALPADFGLVLAAAGQYSGDKLPTSEQVSFGRWRYAMGYPQGEQSGDKGLGGSVELNRRFATGWQVLSVAQPYAMLDYARTWYNSDALQQLNGRHLSSASLGLRVTDDRNYLFDFNIARPVGAIPTGEDRRGLQFSANYLLFYGGI